MSTAPADWRALWAGGDLGRFCFVSLGILLHATNETIVATVMPAMVADIDGVEMVGWSLATYVIGSITAGAASGRLVSYMPLRTNMAGAALAFVSVERLFARDIWPKLFAIMSVVWGVSAFSGPLIGAVGAEFFSWRWTFGAFSAVAFVMSAVSFVVLSTPAARHVKAVEGDLPPFPFRRLLVLAAAITMIAGAGVVASAPVAAVLITSGFAGIAAFFLLDARHPSARLFPLRPFDPRTTLGRGLIMLAAFSVGTAAFTIYGPLILTTLHGVPVIMAGYMIAAEAIA